MRHYNLHSVVFVEYLFTEHSYNLFTPIVIINKSSILYFILLSLLLPFYSKTSYKTSEDIGGLVDRYPCYFKISYYFLIDNMNK